MIGEAFIAGFLTCYIASSALILRFNWRREPPLSVAEAARDIVYVLSWPRAFLRDDES